MALRKTQAVVIGRMALGESDRLVTFYTREFGKVRGVAKAARRQRSRFGSALWARVGATEPPMSKTSARAAEKTVCMIELLPGQSSVVDKPGQYQSRGPA